MGRTAQIVGGAAAFGLAANLVGIGINGEFRDCVAGVQAKDIGRVASHCIAGMAPETSSAIEPMTVLEETAIGSFKVSTYGDAHMKIGGDATFTYKAPKYASWHGLGGPDGVITWSEEQEGDPERALTLAYTPCIRTGDDYKKPLVDMTDADDKDTSAQIKVSLAKNEAGEDVLRFKAGYLDACYVREPDDPNLVFANKDLFDDKEHWWRGSQFGSSERAYHEASIFVIARAFVKAKACPWGLTEQEAVAKDIAKIGLAELSLAQPENAKTYAQMINNGRYWVEFGSDKDRQEHYAKQLDDILDAYRNRERTPKNFDGETIRINKPKISPFSMLSRCGAPDTTIRFDQLKS